MASRAFSSGLGAYLIWGTYPLYWASLSPSGPWEALAHRIAWSMLLMAAVVAVARRWPSTRAILRSPRQLVLQGACAALIAANWGTYIWGVTHGHVVESALGYFLNPLVLVLLGFAFLGERPRRVQWVAFTIGSCAVLVLTVDYGHPPYVALILGITFGVYGLLKKQAGTGSIEGVAVECFLLAPVAIAVIGGFVATGTSTFTVSWPLHALLLASTAVVSSGPLLLFAVAANELPLTVLGILQYIAPVMHFVIGLAVFHEAMTSARWLGFSLVWSALLLFMVEGLLVRRVRGRAASPV